MNRKELQAAMEANGIPTDDMEAAVAIWNLAIDAASGSADAISEGSQGGEDGRPGTQWLYSDRVQDQIVDEQKIYE
jgi:hypothetical protein